MKQELINEILKELDAIKTAPSCDEIVVTKEKLMERARWMCVERGYVHTLQTLQALESYMKGYCLALEGPVGVGKTHFFESVGDGGIVFLSPMKFMAEKLDDIAYRVNEAMYKDVVIDDIGAEPEYNNYGSKLDILPWIIEKRIESPCRTHITTNRTTKELKERYGVRVMDRMIGMCKFVKMDGNSRRRHCPNRRYVDGLKKKFTVNQ